jgi:hypothetical protein
MYDVYVYICWREMQIMEMEKFHYASRNEIKKMKIISTFLWLFRNKNLSNRQGVECDDKINVWGYLIMMYVYIN